MSDGTREIKWRLVGVLGKWLVDGWFAPSRFRVVNYGNVASELESKRFILAFWHSRILPISYYFKGWNAAILVSRSDDGEIIARVLQRQGHLTVRGSTTRGGLNALKRQIKHLKTLGGPAGIVPDGPQGPRFIVQPGIISLAQLTGYPIVPVSCSARKLKIFSSWDRFILPYPAAECMLIYGHPVRVPRRPGASEFENKRMALETELRRITEKADRFYGHRIE